MKPALLTLLLAFGSFAQTALMPAPEVQLFDNNGSPLNGGKVYAYAAGTSTPLDTYNDAAGGHANTNPVILDASGRAVIRLGSSSYKITLKDRNGVQIWSVDNVSGMVPCPTCLTTSGNQTIAGAETFSNGLTTTAATITGSATITGAIACSGPTACGNMGNASFPFGTAYLQNIDLVTELIPHVTNVPTLGDSTHLFAKVWTTDADIHGALKLSGITGSTQCLHVDTAGAVTGSGSDCGAGGSGSFLPLDGSVAMTGSIKGDGTATIASNATTSLGDSSAYFEHGYFGGTLEAPRVRVLNGTPNTPGDYFDWTNGSMKLLRLSNSSAQDLLVVDDSRALGNPTEFYFVGHVLPNGSATYNLGATGQRWLKTWTQDADISGTLTIAGTIRGDGTAAVTTNATTSIGDSTHYFQDGYFGGTLEAPRLRMLSETPNAPLDYFDWAPNGIHLLRLYNSSGTIIFQVDDSHSGGLPTAFDFDGTVFPNVTNSYGLGSSGQRWLKTWTQNIDISGTITTPSGSAGLSSTITVRNSAGTGTCTLTFSGGILTASTC